MNLFDSHCHIHQIGQDSSDNTAKLWAKSGLTIDQIIRNAQDDGVTQLMLVGCDLEDSKLAINLANNKDMYASIGIHPHDADKYANNSDLLKQFGDLVKSEKVKAVGECGLDYYYSHSSKENQKKLLEFQIELAQKQELPLIFHVRDAYQDFWPIFNKYNDQKKIRGVLHSFTDTMATMKTAIEQGLFIGVNGIATFTKDEAQREIYKQIPLANLMLETDAPYLTPAPIRGNINEPRNVVLVGKYLADLRGESLEDLATTTTNNSRQLFGV